MPVWRLEPTLTPHSRELVAQSWLCCRRLCFILAFSPSHWPLRSLQPVQSQQGPVVLSSPSVLQHLIAMAGLGCAVTYTPFPPLPRGGVPHGDGEGAVL